jgi:DNA invertase Pin-like site-specific DNA recombinase
MRRPNGAIRCAIYTRKSTEEGLDQAFNSLDAQREACAAYIMSQIHEGWVPLPDLYDDGGFSGGNMDRPGLKHLLADVKAGKVDVIVVYKVDRLTRSLTDFAKIVEVLDAHGASFVSVTQAFNTTNSMGRLTLNVLLSFAQFEREVTGERIRDKVAASKAKGMWMGGPVPLGYEVSDRKLVVIPEDAQTVELIFRRYLALGSVRALAEELGTMGIRSKERVSRTGRVFGNAPFSRGALYLLLQNRIYIGRIVHKDVAYPGEHAGIIEPELFEQVGAMIRQNRTNHVNGVHIKDPSLLVGKVWDAKGRRMSPNHTTRKGRCYRYYRSRTDGPAAKATPWSVPAGDLDGLVLTQLRRRLDLESVPTSLRLPNTACGSEQREAISAHVKRIEIHADKVVIQFTDGAQPDEVIIRACIVRRGKETRLAVPPEEGAPHRRDPALIKLVVNAHRAREALAGAGERSVAEVAGSLGYTRDYYGVLLRIAYLAPDIVAAILDGRQPAQLNRQKLARVSGLPIEWQAQRGILGFA